MDVQQQQMSAANKIVSRKLKYSVDEALYAEGMGLDERDAKTPDAWIPRHTEMVRLTGIHPFNSESPAQKLLEAGFITPTSIHYTRNHGAVPQISWEEHRLEIVADEDEVAKGFTPVELTMEDLLELPSVSVTATLTCAGNRRKEENLTNKTVGFSWNSSGTSTAMWRGVRMRDVLLKYCKLAWRSDEEEDEDENYPLEERYVWMVGADDLPKGNYGTCIPLGLAMNIAGDVILAFEVNGKPLPPDRGFPLRVVVPGWIGGRMVKWLKRLEIRKGESNNYYHYFDNRILPPNVTKEIADADGWWMRTEYLFNELNINSVILAPFHEDTLIVPSDKEAKALTLKGYAYTGSGKRITRVEVSFDYGNTWQLCQLHVTERPTRYGMYWCWVQWSYEASAAELATPHRMIHCRAWDQSNNTQPNRLTWNVMGMGNNCIFGVRVDHFIREEDGTTELRFIHPTQEAGMSTVGWMQNSHRPPPAVPPVRIADAAGYDDTEGSSTTLEEDDDKENAVLGISDEELQKLPEFSMAEVAQHVGEDSAWIVVRNRVYDCTAFLEDHPGGASSILMAAGTDATEDVEAIHSPKAIAMLQDYLIGRLAVAPSGDVATPGKVDKFSVPSDPDAPWLNARAWVDFDLLEKHDITSNIILLRFAPSARTELHDRRVGLPVGMHVMIKSFASDGSTVIRPYTPIVLSSWSEEKDEFTLLIKVYHANEHPKFPEGGKMSQILNRLKVGDSLQVKGPCGHIAYPEAGKLQINKKTLEVDEIGFMCGGTGITPAFRVIEASLANPNDRTILRLIYANNSVADIALRDEIDALASLHPDRFFVHYTISQPPDDEPWNGSIGYITEEMARQYMPKAGERSFVGLCGPPPMLKFACIPSLEKLGYSPSQFDCF